MLQSFAHITTVPQCKDLIDIALSKTNRKTPTVIRAHYEIHRIRSFYVRKVKFSAGEFAARLSEITTQFPVLEDAHPFYADLIGLLYDRDHYKIALGHVNSVKHQIETICKEHIRLLKYGDSLHRCKHLKRAALGKMATAVKKLADPLKYLEEVRQHLSRLPAIDPAARTLILCGFPNVGKSSFMNRVSRAHVDVHSYAFTTRSLYLGHFEHESLRWQILDTPGLLDRPLEERNTIELQTVTALAHLRAAVLFFIDISETCGHSIAEQIALYENLAPLLRAQILVVLAKADLRPLSAVEDAALTAFLAGKPHIEISAATGMNVTAARDTVCAMLLDERVAAKRDRISDYIHRIVPAAPAAFHPRDESPALGQSPFLGLHECETYFCEEKHDIIPEFFAGKNIADFVDPAIRERVEAARAVVAQDTLRTFDVLNSEERTLLQACNDARINANMRAHFVRRMAMPASWKNRITSRGELVADLRAQTAVPVVKPAVEHVDKRVARGDNKRYLDMAPRHAYRPVSTKHGKLKRN